jgi:protein-S-isoprenylcysteine O-methyltransferase Ste14
MSQQDNPGVLIPPPAYIAAVIALAFGLDIMWPIHLEYQSALVWMGYSIVLASIVILLLCAWQFHRHATDIRPHKPATCMIKAGPYRYSRNPIYLCFLLLQLGYGLAVLQVWTLLLLPVSYLVLRYHVIAREEAYLGRIFGAKYLQFCTEVRRWL